MDDRVIEEFDYTNTRWQKRKENGNKLLKKLGIETDLAKIYKYRELRLIWHRDGRFTNAESWD